MKKILVSNVLAYIVPGKKELYLSILNNKKHNVLVKKGVDKVLSELSIYEASFELKFSLSEDGCLTFVKNKDLPCSDEYYKVLNFDKESALGILLEIENDKGIFKTPFEAYIDETSNEVSFIGEGMKDYKPALDEMTRRFYTELGKKTKKWIPGHRYDCLEGTYYYLGEFLSRKKEEFNSLFMTSLEDFTPVHIYTKKLGGEKKISDVFRNQTYTENELNVIWSNTLPSCVDSGQVLEDDTPSLSSLYLDMINNAISKFDIDELKPVFDILCYSSHLDPLVYPKEIKEPILGIIQKLIERVVLDNWNKVRSREDRCIGDKIEPSLNTERIKNILLGDGISDGNILERYYYNELFNALSINLEDEISKFLSTWNEADLYSSFSEFCKYNKYFLDRTQHTTITSTQRAGDKIVKISDLFGNGPLHDAIIELVKKAELNYGEGVSSYRIVKVGKNNTVTCIIELNDIINNIDLTDELKDEIILYKFSKVVIYFDKDKEIN